MLYSNFIFTGSECDSLLKLDGLENQLSLESCASLQIHLTDGLAGTGGPVRTPQQQLLHVGGQLSSVTIAMEWQGTRLSSVESHVRIY